MSLLLQQLNVNKCYWRVCLIQLSKGTLLEYLRVVLVVNKWTSSQSERKRERVNCPPLFTSQVDKEVAVNSEMCQSMKIKRNVPFFLSFFLFVCPFVFCREETSTHPKCLFFHWILLSDVHCANLGVIELVQKPLSIIWMARIRVKEKEKKKLTVTHAFCMGSGCMSVLNHWNIHRHTHDFTMSVCVCVCLSVCSG